METNTCNNKNRGLLFFLKLKVALTLLLWLPPLLLPDPLLNWMIRAVLGIDRLEPKIFIHLLGAAFLALTINYWVGIKRIKAKKEVEHIVWVGVVSNGLASLLIFLYGFLGSYQEWSLIGQIYMWFSAFLAGFITVGLLVTGLLKSSRKHYI